MKHSKEERPEGEGRKEGRSPPSPGLLQGSSLRGEPHFPSMPPFLTSIRQVPLGSHSPPPKAGALGKLLQAPNPPMAFPPPFQDTHTPPQHHVPGTGTPPGGRAVTLGPFPPALGQPLHLATAAAGWGSRLPPCQPPKVSLLPLLQWRQPPPLPPKAPWPACSPLPSLGREDPWEVIKPLNSLAPSMDFSTWLIATMVPKPQLPTPPSGESFTHPPGRREMPVPPLPPPPAPGPGRKQRCSKAKAAAAAFVPIQPRSHERAVA